MPADRSGRTRWLDDAEQAAWRSFVAMRGLLDEAIDRELQQTAGMPHAYYRILAMLSEADDRRLRITELASLVHASHSRISHAVSALEAKGWLARELCPTDRRVTYASMTGEGMAVLRRAAPSHVATVRRAVFDVLDADEVQQLRVLSDRILQALAPFDSP